MTSTQLYIARRGAAIRAEQAALGRRVTQRQMQEINEARRRARRPLSEWSRMLRALDVPDRVRRALACIVWWEWFSPEKRMPGDNTLIDDLLVTPAVLRGRPVMASASDATDEELYAGLVALRVDRQWAHRRIFGAKRKGNS